MRQLPYTAGASVHVGADRFDAAITEEIYAMNGMDEASEYVKVTGMKNKTPPEATAAFRRTWGVEHGRDGRRIGVITLDNDGAFKMEFLDYVTNPTLPALLEILFGVPAPSRFPRDDLVAAFLTGVDGLNQPAGVTAGEMLRLNTAIDPVAPAFQSRLGVLGGDIAGFPNGRRPGDDVVDIELRVVMGVLLDDTEAPVGQLPFTDGAIVDSTFFDSAFPYLRTPLPGSPNSQP